MYSNNSINSEHTFRNTNNIDSAMLRNLPISHNSPKIESILTPSEQAKSAADTIMNQTGSPSSASVEYNTVLAAALAKEEKDYKDNKEKDNKDNKEEKVNKDNKEEKDNKDKNTFTSDTMNDVDFENFLKESDELDKKCALIDPKTVIQSENKVDIKSTSAISEVSSSSFSTQEIVQPEKQSTKILDNFIMDYYKNKHPEYYKLLVKQELENLSYNNSNYNHTSHVNNSSSIPLGYKTYPEQPIENKVLPVENKKNDLVFKAKCTFEHEAEGIALTIFYNVLYSEKIKKPFDEKKLKETTKSIIVPNGDNDAFSHLQLPDKRQFALCKFLILLRQSKNPDVIRTSWNVFGEKISVAETILRKYGWSLPKTPKLSHEIYCGNSSAEEIRDLWTVSCKYYNLSQ